MDNDTHTHIRVEDGRVVVRPGAGVATLTWRDADVTVLRNSQPQPHGVPCRVAAEDLIEVVIAPQPPQVDYVVEASRDRMSATLRVDVMPGRTARLADDPGDGRLELRLIRETFGAPPVPTGPAASAEIAQMGITWGVDADAVAQALAHPGQTVIVATGREPSAGADGSVEILLDADEARAIGVVAGTEIARIRARIPEVAGRDVHGTTLDVRATRDAVFRLGAGVVRAAGDPELVVASVDGAPHVTEDGVLDVQHELHLDMVNAQIGDVRFVGSIHVHGAVGDGRRVIAGHHLTVDGEVERAHLEALTGIVVHGSIMSSVVRAGGERAVAAAIFERVSPLPMQLLEALGRADELCEAAERRGAELAFGLAAQLVMEKLYRPMLGTIAEIASELALAGDAHVALSQLFAGWHRTLVTAAIGSLSAIAMGELITQISQEIALLRDAIEQRADLSVHSVQASELEATGAIEIAGKGVFNSRLVAWCGVVCADDAAVIRGGSIVSHGPVRSGEIGSPGGASMLVELGTGASLGARLVYAGTVISTRGHAHRFNADRTDVQVGFTSDGAMDVQSFAA